MFDFQGVLTANYNAKAVRGWAIEQAIDHLREEGHEVSMQGVISLAKMIEDYVAEGDIAGAIQGAVEEGYAEGRFEVRQAMADDGWMLGPVDDLFARKGWLEIVKEG